MRRLLVTIARCYCQDVRVRFAPSPTGSLHIGGYRTALYNYLFAKKHNGTFILRLEDTDQVRVVPHAAQLMEQTLSWGKLNPDESPLLGGNYGPYTQSQRLNFYQDAIDQLIENGHAYKCFCSEKRLELLRRESARNRVTNKYDGHCRNLSKSEIETKLKDKIPYTIRLKVNQEDEKFGVFDDLIFGPVDHSTFVQEGDPILVKSDGFPTYHLANVVDDYHMKISHVFRGIEWQISTPKHFLLYHALGWQPPKFGHLSLIINPDGTKLSKRQGAVHLEHYQNSGYYPETILNFVTLTGGGFSDKKDLCSMEELVEHFDLKMLKTTSSQMNFDLLDQVNKLVIGEKLQHSRSDFVQEAKELLVNQYGTCPVSDEKLEKILVWGQDRLSKLSDLISLPDFKFLWRKPETTEGCDVTLNKDAVKQTVELMANQEFQAANKAVRKLSKSTKVPYPALMKCVRIFLSGSTDGPPVKDMIEQLGIDEAKSRLHIGLEKYLENT